MGFSDVEVPIHPEYVKCQQCNSENLKALHGDYDPQTHLYTVSLAGCTFLSDRLFQCIDCEYTQITPKEIFWSIKYELFLWIKSNRELEFNEYLFDQILEDQNKFHSLIGSITDKKVLAKLRLIAPSKFQIAILKQSSYLDETNPLLKEIELLVNKTIPMLTLDTINEFGYYVENNSILRLNLPDSDLIRLPERISLFPNLRFLSLENNNLQGLPPKFDRFMRLEGLNLRNNQFSTVPEVLQNIDSIQYLSLADNPIDEIPLFLGSMQLDTLQIDSKQYNNNRDRIDQLSIKNISIS